LVYDGYASDKERCHSQQNSCQQDNIADPKN